MARITLADEFAAMHGRVEDVVIYRRWGKQHMRLYVKPSNPDTAAQRERRGTFREAVKAWQALSEADKLEWNGMAKRLFRSGYNFFISCHLGGATTAPGMKRRTVRIMAARRRANLIHLRERALYPPVFPELSSVSAPFMARKRLYPAPAPRISPPR